MSAGNNNSAAPLAKRAEPLLGTLGRADSPPRPTAASAEHQPYHFCRASTGSVFHIFELSAVMVSLARHWR